MIAAITVEEEDHGKTYNIERSLKVEQRFKVLIGYDGSDCAEAALDDLHRAGLPPRGVEAVALTVADVFMLPPPSTYELVADEAAAASAVETDEDFDRRRYAKNLHAMKQAEELAQRAGARLRENFPEWEIKSEATNGSPAWELVVRADQWQPSLIVVGSQGRSVLGRFVMGSVSQRVLTEARCSVRVARGRVEADHPAPVRIIIGIDGSPDSAAALRAVAARQWLPLSEARVIIVEDPIRPTILGRLVPPLVKWAEETRGAEIAGAREIADAALQHLSAAAAALKVSSSVLVGDPKRVLVETAEQWGADCIFVGSTGFSNRVERFVLGSVSAAVAARAHCAVEVVRALKHESE